MNLFQISASWAGLVRPSTPVAPLRNTFRAVAITFEAEAACALPLTRRLVDLHLNRAMLLPDRTKQGYTAYELMVFSLLLPTEEGIIVMTVLQQRSLKAYLRKQVYQLVRDQISPLYDVPTPTLYRHLLAVLYVVENYTSIRPTPFPL